ncbi:MAG: hypothetical protein HKN78_04610 [Sphingomonadaceae bacterium]|nr:hypothetical protein [Sphingomonadaceae bacterium]
MTQNEETLASGDRPSTAKARWTSPILVDLDGDLDDVENDVAGPNSDTGGRPTS